jgi:hypothetical protein
LKKFHTSVATKISFKETTRNIKKGKKKRSFFKFLYGTIPSPNSFAPLKKIGEKEALFARFFFWFLKKKKKKISLDLVTLLFCVQVNRYTSNLALKK